MQDTFKALPLDDRKAQVKAITQRMAQAYNIRRSDLPSIVGCTSNVMNNWVYYGRIPYEELHQCQQQTGASLDWLIYGEKAIPRLTQTERAELEAMVATLLDDAIEYEMLAELHGDSINMLINKFQKTLNRWSGVTNNQKKMFLSG